MRLLGYFCIVLLLASVVLAAGKDEEWSWGTIEGRSAGSKPSSKTSGDRSGRFVFEDTDAKGRKSRVDLGSRFQPTETFRVSSAKRTATKGRTGVRSVQPVDNPLPVPVIIPQPVKNQFVVHRPPIRISDDGPQSNEEDIPPVFTPVRHEIDLQEVTLPVATTVDRNGRKIHSEPSGNSEGRFFNDIDKKLCNMGIGWDCKKGGGRPVQYVNLDHLPVLPQPVLPPHPPQYPHPPPAPLPYGGGLDSANVHYVQPVALQPVGRPIQAIPLGPAGGAVPHPPLLPGAPHASTYGAGHLGLQHGGLQQGAFEAGGFHQGAFQHGTVHQGVISQGFAPQEILHQGAVVHHGAINQGSYGQEVHSVNHAYEPPQLQPSYGPPTETYKVVHQGPIEYKDDNGKVVQHIHQHTHIYEGGQPVVLPYDSSHSSSAHRPAARPSIEHRPLPVVPPHPNSLQYSAGYREACECVPSHRCSAFDMVARSEDFGLLDARNNKANILSNTTDSSTNEQTPTRDKRDTSKFKRQTNSFLKAEERRLRIGYIPGPNGCLRGDVCCRNAARSDNFGPKAFSCGQQHSALIVGRVKTPVYETGDTTFGEFPWQAAILKHDGGDMVYVCGASLIDDQNLLTAAHCIHKLKPYELIIRLGEWDVQNEDEYYPNVDYDVEDVILHPAFYAGMLHNDIAIIRMSSRVNFKKYPHISPVCLPDPHSHFDGEMCDVTGWGKDAFGKVGSFQNLLKKVQVPMVRKSSCETALQRTRLGRSFKLTDGMSCAGGEEDKDACKGDGGGPLVCRGHGGLFQLAGIVSWGIGCGERGIPGVYVDVPYYVDWIYENTR
ncbi:Serine proteases trypsin domain [Trinorchestia longiramus]|nr:Serine proteases trypsin domain [Trinorchestia longiramus]